MSANMLIELIIEITRCLQQPQKNVDLQTFINANFYSNKAINILLVH